MILEITTCEAKNEGNKSQMDNKGSHLQIPQGKEVNELYANRGDICLYVFFRCATPAHALHLAGLP
jgi:hypothetical protein